MWTLFEPVHVISYFAPAATSAFEQAGLRGFWRGYFAGRVAPLGPEGAAPVVAAFSSFAPAMVSRALPAVWDLITPAEALAVRQEGAVAALRHLLGMTEAAAVPEPVRTAADQLAGAVQDLDIVGRVLAAANSALPVPSEPLARLWHAATVLREHRGDGHVAALVAADIDGCESLVLRVGVDLATAGQGHVRASWTREQIQPMRGWTDEQWDEATNRLVSRGLVQADGDDGGVRPATAAGVALHRGIEDATDRAAARPWAALGAGRVKALADLLRPVSAACATVLPSPNPVGVPVPGRG